jgi:hypothetical protein
VSLLRQLGREPSKLAAHGGAADPGDLFNRPFGQSFRQELPHYVDPRPILKAMKQPSGFAGAAPIQHRPTWRADEGPPNRRGR